jgi:hypothetical protein
MARMLLKGKSGLIAPGIHVSAPYDSNGKVFVEYEFRKKLANGKLGIWQSWKRMTLARAKKEKRHIIKCLCGKPAIQMDHFWPYYWDDTLCVKCSKKLEKNDGTP